ncbi:hypothetical protein R6Q59_005527 [Mikania micrantha]
MSTETSSSYRSIGSSIVTSIEDEFLEKIEFSTIADISGIVEVKSLIVVGTVKGVCKDISWYYNACSNCSRKVKIEFNDAEDKKVVICNNSKCIDQLVAAVPRFKIPIRVQDYTGVVSLTLFDREALKLLHISAQYLLEMTLQDSTNDMIPQHFNGFMDKKYAFRIEVTKYNLENNIDFYSISKVTDDASIISELEKKYPFSQNAESESIHATQSEMGTENTINIKDTDSFTGDNDTPISDSERLKGKKVIVDEHISSSLFANDNLKRNLDCVYDVDEATALSSTKQRISNKQDHAIDHCTVDDFSALADNEIWYNIVFLIVDFIWYDIIGKRLLFILLDQHRHKIAAFAPQHLIHLYNDIVIPGSLYTLNHFKVENFNYYDQPKYEGYTLICTPKKIMINEETKLLPIILDIPKDVLGRIVAGERILGEHRLFIQDAT